MGCVKVEQPRAVGGGNRLFGSDRIAVCVQRAGKQSVCHCPVRAHSSGIAQPLLFKDDAAFFFGLFLIQSDMKSPFLKNVDGFIQQMRFIGRNLKFVNRFVVGGVSVELRTESDAHRFKKGDQLLSFITAGAVKRHVLQKMRQSALIIPFVAAAGFNGQL